MPHSVFILVLGGGYSINVWRMIECTMSSLSNKQTKQGMSEWMNHFSFVLFQSWRKVNICKDLVYEKRIPHMTLILFKCVPAVRQDFINIFSTSCLLNIIARFSWQVPFTSHIPVPERVTLPCGASSFQSWHKSDGKRQMFFFRNPIQDDVLLQGQGRHPLCFAFMSKNAGDR